VFAEETKAKQKAVVSLNHEVCDQCSNLCTKRSTVSNGRLEAARRTYCASLLNLKNVGNQIT